MSRPASEPLRALIEKEQKAFQRVSRASNETRIRHQRAVALLAVSEGKSLEVVPEGRRWQDWDPFPSAEQLDRMYPSLCMLLILDNLAGHSSRDFVSWCHERGIGLLYWNDVFASPGVSGIKVMLRFDPFDISHIYAFVHNHWVECVTSSYYGQLHGHSEREIALASAELREQNRKSHVRAPIDAKRRADFLAKIEAHEVVLL